MRIASLILLAGLIVPAGVAGIAAAQPADSTATATAGPRVSIAVDLEADDGTSTPLGTIVIELDPAAAPKHAANFEKLAREGFYDGTAFHRIVPGFIIEGGDPLSRADWTSPRIGTGGPGYELDPEMGLKHVRGAVAASRRMDAGDNPNRKSNGSMFFICLADLPSLDSTGFTVFGHVVQGMDVVDRIARVKNAGPKNHNRALQRVVMRKATVME